MFVSTPTSFGAPEPSFDLAGPNPLHHLLLQNKQQIPPPSPDMIPFPWAMSLKLLSAGMTSELPMEPHFGISTEVGGQEFGWQTKERALDEEGPMDLTVKKNDQNKISASSTK